MSIFTGTFAARLAAAILAIGTASALAAPLPAPLAPVPASTDIIPVLNAEPAPDSLGALVGSEAKLTGYLLPVDLEGEFVYRFALVPFPGACSHMPQPPAGTIVLVTPDEPWQLDHVYEHVTVEGRLKLRPELSQFYMVDGVVMLESDYVISKAEVGHAAEVSTRKTPGASPWKFLGK
jgi:hypothetical protein